MIDYKRIKSPTVRRNEDGTPVADVSMLNVGDMVPVSSFLVADVTRWAASGLFKPFNLVQIPFSENYAADTVMFLVVRFQDDK